ncbi:hypothetical protein FCIRC_12830 [Fusarium circinatum]|uniref:Uncharacterized protein n=1 Tax=Fusarium circinatum TaxID=48490 RepID=A0A8H5WDN2_FUSCI|nr:hypothetical protein FCIRC_12830 [Fusarium circinatum]
MRILTQSLIVALLSTQPGVVYAGPCKPSGITATTETIYTTAIAKSSTATTAGEPSTTAHAGVSTSTTVSELSTTVTLNEPSTTTSLSDVLTSTGLPDSTTTTTSIDIPLGTTLTAISVQDGSEVSAFLPMDDDYEDGYIIGDPNAKSAGALFGLEPETSRLYAVFPNGEKLYAVSCTQCSNYGFRFMNEEKRQSEYFVAYARCTEGESRYLDCIPEDGETSPYPYMYFYQVGSFRYYQARDSGRFGQPAVEFRLG